MVRLSFVNVAAIATLLLGAEAGPCRPSTTAATSVAETTSTLASDTSATSIASTTVVTPTETTTTIREDTTTSTQAESTTTTLADTTTTDKAESTTTTLAGTTTTLADTTTSTQAESTTTTLADTTTTLADTTTTTQAESTTTTAAAGCVETQLFLNPDFDDSPSGISPWNSNFDVIQNQPQSGTNALAAYMANGAPSYYVKQTLQNLNGDYEFSYYYKVVSVSQNADYTCNIELKVGDATIPGPINDSVGGWTQQSVRWSSAGQTIAQADVQLGLTCYGEFTGIEVDIDTLGFTRVCNA